MNASTPSWEWPRDATGEILVGGQPLTRVVDAIENAAAWFEAHDLEDTAIERIGLGPDVLHAHADDRDVLRLAARIALEQGASSGNLRLGRALSRRLLRVDPASVVALHNLALIALRRRRDRRISKAA